MRALLIMASVAILLVGCSERVPSQYEMGLIAQLETAPPKTILITDPLYPPTSTVGLTSSGYLLVICGHQEKLVEVARVGFWDCGSSASRANLVSPSTLVTEINVSWVVEPTDTDYGDLVKRLKPFLADLKAQGRPPVIVAGD